MSQLSDPQKQGSQQITPELIQNNIIATKNRLNAIQGQANGMISESVNQEINAYGSIIMQLLQQVMALQNKVNELSKNDKKKPLSEKTTTTN